MSLQAVLVKRAPGDARPEGIIEQAVRQIISRALDPEGVIGTFAAAGVAKSVRSPTHRAVSRKACP